MANETGWIKAHRDWRENPVIWKDPECLKVWLYLCFGATHSEYKTFFNGKPITLHGGQLIRGRLQIAEDTKINESKVKRILIKFKTAQLIDQLTSPRGSLISLKNWDIEQKSDQPNEQQMTSQCPVNKNERTSENNIHRPKAKASDDGDQFLKDFEKIYAAYPKKIGKAKGMENIRKWIGSGFRIDGRSYKASKREVYAAILEYKYDKLDGDLNKTPDKDDLQYWKDFSTLTGKSLLDYIERARERERDKGATA